jgi:hypothetical protein
LRSTKWSTNCCGPPPPVSRFVPLTPDVPGCRA